MTELKRIEYSLATNGDTLISLTLSKEDLSAFRHYVTRLEYEEKRLTLVERENELLDSKVVSLEKEVDVYKDKLSITNSTLSSQMELYNEKEKSYEELVKQSRKQGRKEGAIGIGGIVLLILLLL